jgi:predicted phage-related endonuclease
MIERRPIVDREQWLSWRKRDVTASWIGALFGVDPSPKKTALRLYASKRGTEFVEEDNKIMRRGRWLEPAVAEAVRELRPGWRLVAPKLYFRDDQQRLGCTPDFFIEGDERGLGVLQAKTVAPSVYAREWDGGKEIPLWIVLQTLTEMMLTGATFGAVAVLLVDPFNMDCPILDVPRHEGSERKIVQAVQNFWQQVANGIEPEPDFERDADVIKALSPRETPGKRIDFNGNNALPQMLADRAAYMAIIDDAETKKEAIETEIKFLMGDAESANGIDGWRITYKVQNRAGYTVPPKTPRVLLIRDQRGASHE